MVLDPVDITITMLNINKPIEANKTSHKQRRFFHLVLIERSLDMPPPNVGGNRMHFVKYASKKVMWIKFASKITMEHNKQIW